ncbi:density-regulated protein isoform X1 [Prionailurus iriomotensis]
MAADISESGGHDCKGEPRGNTKLDADYPLRVLYCGVCSLPTEYCEYMPDVAKCRQWLEKNFPNEFAKLTVENSPKQDSGISEGQGTAGEEEEKKKQKREWKGSNKAKKEDCTTKGYDSQNSQSKEEICNKSMWPCNFWVVWEITIEMSLSQEKQ